MSLTVLRILARHASRDGDYGCHRRYPAGVLPDNAGMAISRRRCVAQTGGQLWLSTHSLTALWNCPNGELRHHTDEINAICEEVAAVIEREGYHTSAAGRLRYYVEQVIDSAAEKTSHPYLQDVRASAPYRN